jgi:hypothetical protein
MNIFINNLNNIQCNNLVQKIHYNRFIFLRGFIQNLIKESDYFFKSFCINVIFISFIFSFQKIVFICIFVTNVEIFFRAMRDWNPLIIQKFNLKFDPTRAYFGISMWEWNVAWWSSFIHAKIQIIEWFKKTVLPSIGLPRVYNIIKVIDVLGDINLTKKLNDLIPWDYIELVDFNNFNYIIVNFLIQRFL